MASPIETHNRFVVNPKSSTHQFINIYFIISCFIFYADEREFVVVVLSVSGCVCVLCAPITANSFIFFFFLFHFGTYDAHLQQQAPTNLCVQQHTEAGGDMSPITPKRCVLARHNREHTLLNQQQMNDKTPLTLSCSLTRLLSAACLVNRSFGRAFGRVYVCMHYDRAYIIYVDEFEMMREAPETDQNKYMSYNCLLACLPAMYI